MCSELVPQDDDAVLLEVDDQGTFLVLGNELAGQETLPLPFLGDRGRGELGRLLRESASALNLAVQALNGYNQVQGLVRLAPETLQALRAGAQPLVKDGWNLGTLANGSGKFTQQVRWLPAGSAGAVSVLASLGPAATLIAIQWQLGKIQRLVERNLELTGEVLQAVRSSDWAEARAHHDVVMRGLDEARHLGAVTPAVWANLESQASQAALAKHRHLYLERVQQHHEKLWRQSGSVKRQEWLQQHGAAVLRDVESLLMAQRAWLVYQVLRAAFLSRTAADNPDDAKLLAKVVEDAKAAHRAALDASEPLVDGLYRHFRLAEISPGGRGLRIGKKDSAAKDVAKAANVLAEHLKAMGGDIAEPAAGVLRPSHGWVRVDKPLEVSDRVRWLLAPDEELFAVAYGSMSGWGFFTWGYTVVTNRRILFCRDRQLMNDGLVDRELSWSKIDEVELSENKGWGGIKDIILTHGKDKTKIEFDGKTEEDAVAHLVVALKRVREAGAVAEGSNQGSPALSGSQRAALRQLDERLALAGADDGQQRAAHDAFLRALNSRRPRPLPAVVDDALAEAYWVEQRE